MWLILYLCWAVLGLSCANQEAGPSMTVNKHAHYLDSASALLLAPQTRRDEIMDSKARRQLQSAVQKLA